MENVTLKELIAWIESRGNIGALRFEPATYSKLTLPGVGIAPNASAILARIKAIHACSSGTALMIYSTSWGKYQVMGFNLYSDNSFVTPITEYVSSTSLQDASFSMFLKRNGLQDFTPGKLASDTQARLKFAMTYNGSIAYVDAMLAALAHFGIPVTGN